jgi:hypothetical protein
VPFSPALYETHAIIVRSGARVSAGVRELLAAIEAHMARVGEEFDRAR